MDFQALPKLRDSMSYLYIEHAVLERKDSALLVLQETGRTLVPVANICVVLLGPGTSVTHAAVDVMTKNGCSIVWTGQDGFLFYAQGMGETHKSFHLIRQAEMVSDPEKRLGVVRRMYEKRFGRVIEPDLTIEQLRGMEGVRVRTAYADASKQFGVEWNGRNYDIKDWRKADPVNRALSAANAVLNGVCHAAIVSGGYSPGLGFLHTGWQLSFVYDVADLYKAEMTIPIAFQIAAESPTMVDTKTRITCRDRFREVKLLDRILPDIDTLLQIKSGEENSDELPIAASWWQPAEREE